VADETEKIAFEITAGDSGKQAADDVDAVVAALERQRAALKAIDAAVDQSDFAARLAAYRTEAERLNATQEKSIATLSQVSAVAGRAAADIAEQSKSIGESANKFTDLGNAAAQAFDGLTPEVQKFTAAIDPALKAIDELVAGEQRLGAQSPPTIAAPQVAPAQSIAAAPSLPAVTAPLPATTPSPVPAPAPTAPLPPVTAPAPVDLSAIQASVAAEQEALQKIQALQTEYAVKEKSYEDAARAQRSTQDIQSALTTLEQIRAKYSEFQTANAAVAEATTAEQNAQFISQTTAALEQIKQQFAGMELANTASVKVEVDEQKATIQASVAEIVANVQAAFGDAAGDAETLTKSIAEGLASGIGEELQASIHEAIAAGADPAAVQAIASQLTEIGKQYQELADGNTAVSKSSAEAQAGAIDQQYTAAFDKIRKQITALEADWLAQSKSGLDDQSASMTQRFGEALAAVKSRVAAFENDKLALAKAGLAEQKNLSVQQAADTATALGKQSELLETSKLAYVTSELEEQSAAVATATAEDAELILQKYAALLEAKAELDKGGLAAQQTELEKSLVAQVDTIRKRFEGLDVGKLIVGSSKDAVDGLGSQLDTLTQKLAALKTMDAAAEQSGYLARLASYRAEAAALNAEQDKSASAFKKVASALADSSGAVETTTTKLRSQIGAGASAISQLGQAFTAVVPEIGAFQGALDVGLRSMGGLLGVLGGGPGILLGGLVAGIGVLGAVMSSAKKNADELAKSTLDNKEAYEKYLDEIDKHRGTTSTATIDERNEQRTAITTHQVKVTGEDELQKALTAASASIAQYDTEITRLEKLISDNQSHMKLDVSMSWSELQKQSTLVIPQLKNENEGYREQIELLKQRREVAKGYTDDQKGIDAGKKELADALAEAGAKGIKAKTVSFDQPEAFTPAKATPRPDSAALDAQTREAIRKIADLRADAADKELENDKALAKLKGDEELRSASETLKSIQDKYAQAEIDKKALIHSNLDDQRAAIESEITEALDNVHTHDAEQTVQLEQMRRDAMRQTRDEFLQLEDEKFQAVQKNLQEEQSKRQQMTASLMALGTTASQLAAKQLTEAVKGHKIQGAMILESLGDAMVAEGVRVMFQGAAMSLMGNFASGGGLLALGAAEIGVGLGLGAAGSAAQPPASSSGNGASTTPSSPIRDTQQTANTDSQQRGPTIIYLNMPTVVSPSPEDGLRVQQAIDAASRVYGAPV
jgi:hypothetical protein